MAHAQAGPVGPAPGRPRRRLWPSGLLNRNRLIDGGLLAWALIGLIILGWAAGWLLGQLSLVLVPLVVALFPAALLTPACRFLNDRGARSGLAASVVLGVFVVGVVGILVVLGWLIAGELAGVTAAVEAGYGDLQELAAERFGFELPAIDLLLQQLQDWALGADEPTDDTAAVTGAALTTLELVTSVLLGLVALFFYLKDGERIARWFTHLFPPSVRVDVDEIGQRAWSTLGAYFRGQLVVAAVDAVLIGLGLVVLGVPLALPLAVLVFIGGLFPVVGAFTAGALAILIALADEGLVTALAVLALNVLVQQAEGNLLAPLIVGRATNLHPLVVLVSLTAGAVLFGILGAFLAVPVVASLNAGLSYVVNKDMGRPLDIPVGGVPLNGP